MRERRGRVWNEERKYLPARAGKVDTGISICISSACSAGRDGVVAAMEPADFLRLLPLLSQAKVIRVSQRTTQKMVEPDKVELVRMGVS